MAIPLTDPVKASTPNWSPSDWYSKGWGYDKSLMDYFHQTPGALTTSGLLGTTSFRGLQGLTALGGPIGMQGYANLANILASNGATDPRAMQGMQRGITQGTQANDQNISGLLAQRGLGNSGVGLALRGANQQAGANQQGDLLASEAQKAEERKRSDLATLFQSLLVQPTIDTTALHLGQYNADRSNAQGSQDQKNGQYAQIISAIVAALCHATAELFGDGSSHVDAVRAFMALEAGPQLLGAYARNSRALAFEIAHSASLRSSIEPAFAKMAERGYVLLGG